MITTRMSLHDCPITSRLTDLNIYNGIPTKSLISLTPIVIGVDLFASTFVIT